MEGEGYLGRASRPFSTATDGESSALQYFYQPLHTNSTRQVVYEPVTSGMMMAAVLQSL